MKKILIALALLMATPVYAGGPIMIKDWYNECTASSKNTIGYIQNLVCLRYARGVADGLTLWKMIDPTSAIVCMPANVEANQLVEVGKKYYRDNPKDQHVEAAVLLGLAFKDAFPCATETPTTSFK